MAKENEYDFYLSSEKKEDKLVQWAAREKGLSMGQFAKEAILEKAKQMFVEKKKLKEDKELKKKEAVEKEEAELIEEIETTGELELRKRYALNNWKGRPKKGEEIDMPPKMEGEIPREILEDEEETLEEEPEE